MKKLLGLCISLMVLSTGLCAFAAHSHGTPVSYGIRVETFSKGGTFNMSKQPVVAPAVGNVNTSGQAQLVGYYSHRRHVNMIPRHNGQYKTYDRKTVKRVSVNKTKYRNAGETRKTQYKNPPYRNRTLEAYNGR